MEERYQILARAGVRQLSEYNRLSEEELYRRVQPESEEEWSMIPRSLPYMVIVADEMADLMMTSAKEVETHIIRLAQKSRAVGIHLVLATQKPTVDIITGLIKSNLPARIAFEVASRSDSQVVLDRNGAEKLLGNGDMLFLRPGTSQVIRGQGTYVSDGEIESIVEAIATDEPEYAEELVALKTDEEDEEIEDASKGKDDLYEEAVEFVIREGRGSLSLLQRRFSIGYSRAARMIDQMAEDGVVGPYNGSKSRAVITTLHDWRKKKEEHREIVEHAISSRPSSPDSPRNFHGGENREENFNTGISGRENPKNPGKPRRKKLSVMRNSGSPNPSRGHFTNDPGESDPHGTGYPSSASVVPELREERVRIEPPGKIIKLTESEHYDGEKERRPNSPHETDFYKEEDSPYENPSFESDYEEESEGETWEFVDEYGDYDEEEWTEEENEGDSGENEYPGEYGEEYESEYEEKYEEY